MALRLVVLGFIIGSLVGCASYQSKPLPIHADSSKSVASVTINQNDLPFQVLTTHKFNPADGFDIDEIAMLAVANNPELKQARDNLGIARAQAFAAGLLPDPQLGISMDHPTNAAVGNTNAFNLNLSEDINAFLLHSSRKEVAASDIKRVNMELLWQEWQVVSQARLLFTRLTIQSILMKQLRTSLGILQHSYDRNQRALADGNQTIDVVGTELISLQSVEQQVNELERNELQNRTSLNALLGMAADVTLPLVGEPKIVPIDVRRIKADIDQYLLKRPDLLALQAGYRSQEKKYRGAVLAQFPALNIGITRARDTSDLYTLGFGLSLSLPVLNGNRGNIAIEKTTRKKLFDEYQARLNSAHNEILTALGNLPLLQNQYQRTEHGEKKYDDIAQRTKVAFQAGNIAAADYVRIQSALLNKQTEVLNLREALLEQQIALETELGPEVFKQNKQDGDRR